ncbi:MAG: PIG-L family deacetylase [Dehalococcoidia bacterium]|nr:PIG-L family deacetylase [Dehalococcoidia bacterium]
MPTALVLVPHPDDEAYAFGGLLRLLADAGWRLRIHCASSGEGGERHDGGQPGPAYLGPARELELSESCRLLGAHPPVPWRLPDGGLARLTGGGPGRVAAALSDTNPDLLLTLGPDGAYGHPDHLALYSWVVEAWSQLPLDGRPPLLFAAFPRGLFLPQYEKCIDMMGNPPDPPPEAIGRDDFDLDLDISTVSDVKLAAIAAHRSQLPSGDPGALFPPGIIQALLHRERYTAADSASRSRAHALLAELRT